VAEATPGSEMKRTLSLTGITVNRVPLIGFDSGRGSPVGIS
jgi:hypothetical protein